MIHSNAATVDEDVAPDVSDLRMGLPDHMWLRAHTRAWITRRLRISLTDHCNFSCFFCHNEGQGRIRRLPPAPMPIDDITTIIRTAAQIGVDSVKLTGGEPLLYRSGGSGIIDLIKAIATLRATTPQLDISLTTNGSLMPEYATALRDAGLNRVTLSLATLQPDTFRCLISRNARLLDRSVAGIRAAHDARLSPVKVNVPLYHSDHRNVGNLHELRRLLDVARAIDVAEIRLFSLLWHPEFRQFDEFYQFFSATMKRELIDLLVHCGVTGPGDTVDLLAQLAFRFAQRPYPKVEFGIELGSVALGFEPMLRGRLTTGDGMQEGPYAMRISADGALRPTLNGPPSYELIKAVRRGEDAATLGSLYRVALEELP